MRFNNSLKIFLISIILFFIGCTSTIPKLSLEAKSIIKKAVKSEIPEIVKGETGFAMNNSVKIWYESLQAKDSVKATVLLIMGIANDGLAWPDYFIQPMIDSGYQVIRFDYRGTGLSDWMEDWSKSNAYSLSDIADDGIAILDKLQIKNAHLIGLSMGGMVAQEISINYPDRVLSLTSIMSSGYIEDPELPGVSVDMINDFIKLCIKYGTFKSEIKALKLQITARHLLMGDKECELDYKKISEMVLYNIRNRNGYNFKVLKQHSHAISISGSRYTNLEKIQTPSLIIHGKSDPFIPLAHSEKYAEFIPNAKIFWIDDLGHDIPEEFSDTILNRIFTFYNHL